MESYARWEIVADIDFPCASIVLHADSDELTVLMRFSAVRGAPKLDLLLEFEPQVLACMSHEELVYPYMGHERPKVPTLDGVYTFPLLHVRESRWVASFPDSQLLDHQRADANHYRMFSLDNIVDVLTEGQVTAKWVPPLPNNVFYQIPESAEPDKSDD